MWFILCFHRHLNIVVFVVQWFHLVEETDSVDTTKESLSCCICYFNSYLIYELYIVVWRMSSLGRKKRTNHFNFHIYVATKNHRRVEKKKNHLPIVGWIYNFYILTVPIDFMFVGYVNSSVFYPCVLTCKYCLKIK